MADYGFTEKDYSKYKHKKNLLHNRKLRLKNQTFADVMCASSIVEGIEESEGNKILEVIKKAGDIGVRKNIFN